MKPPTERAIKKGVHANSADFKAGRGSFQESPRERKHRINATLAHWRPNGRAYTAVPDAVGHPRAPRGLVAMWANATYSVQVLQIDGGMTHLMIRRHDEGKDFPWYDLQDAKNMACGEERVGVEVFPRQILLVDDANIRHLWVYPPGHDLGFGLA